MTALCLCCVWGVEKGKEQRREGMHGNKNAALTRKALANRLLAMLVLPLSEDLILFVELW